MNGVRLFMVCSLSQGQPLSLLKRSITLKSFSREVTPRPTPLRGTRSESGSGAPKGAGFPLREAIATGSGGIKVSFGFLGMRGIKAWVLPRLYQLLRLFFCE